MPSIGSILSIATTALRAQQEAINVTAHNIANASTEGYSTQRPVFSEGPPLRTATNTFGTGTGLADVARIREVYLDTSFRAESSAASEEEVRSGVLGQVEALLAEPGDGGLSKTLDEFFSAWSSLATSPTSNTARGAVRDQGEALSGELHRLAEGVDGLRQDTESRLLSAVQRVNELGSDVARLNREISASEAGGDTAGDLRDARDRAIDEIATMMPVQVTFRENGSVGVLVSGTSLVDAAQHGTLEVRLTGGQVGIALEGHANNLADIGGSIGGMVTLLNTDLPDARAALDELAEALVTDINAIHATGTNPLGNTGVDFFDATGVLASTIGLSADVTSDTQNVSAGTGGVSGEFRSGANDVALSMSSLRDSDGGTLGTSYANHFRSLATEIGFSVRSSLNKVEVHKTLSEQAETRRSSFSGVSTDEELVRLIQFQTAYSAAARVVSAADELMDSLMRM